MQVDYKGMNTVMQQQSTNKVATIERKPTSTSIKSS